MPDATDALEVSILMPCLNEAETLGACIQKSQQAIAAHHLKAEILVADNGSSDGSVEIAKKLGVQVIHVPMQGYGAALMAGIEAARGTYIVMGDADDSYDFGALLPFIEKLRAGYDIIMGCRLPSGGGTIMPGAMPWLHRWLGNPVLSGIGRLFFRSPVVDFHCGLRAFRRKAILALSLQTIGMEFASEMVIKATLQGLRFAEVPITLYKDGRSRPPHLRSWRDGWRHLRFMLVYSPSWLFFIPGSTLVLVGTTFGSILLVSPVHLFGLGFDTNTLLVCAMLVLIGFNLMAFAMFAKVFAMSQGLLPEDPRFNKLFRTITLEMGILVGLCLTLMGSGLLVWSVVYWGRFHFGALSYPDSLRIVIPGVMACTLGIEVIFSSFFLSTLGLRRK